MRSGIYLAASMAQQTTILARTAKLKELGVRVNSSWPYQPAHLVLTEKVMLEIADRDLRDLRVSELVIVDTTVASSSGGWHSEVGAAAALGITLWAIGDRKTQSNVFLRKAARWFLTWDDAKDALIERTPVKSATRLSVTEWNVASEVKPKLTGRGVAKRQPMSIIQGASGEQVPTGEAA